MLSRVTARTYSTAAQGLKVSSRDASGKLSKVTVVVNNAGSKAGKSGLAHLLSKSNFLNTETKSALRFNRESELLGGVYSSNVTRDSIVLSTQFLKEDLPYYVEGLGNVLTKTSFRPHEFTEIVVPVAKAEYANANESNEFKALESLHEISFRRGLGHPLYYDGLNKITIDEVKQFASDVYNTSNVSLYASGVNEEDLNKFINESALSALPSGASKNVPVKSYEGAESRIKAAGGSVALIGVPVKPADFGKYEVLSAAVGSAFLPGHPGALLSIPGATSKLLKYQDAGLFVVSVADKSGSAVAEGIRQAKKILESVSSSDLSNATKLAELSIALQSTFSHPLSYKAEASPIKFEKFNYVAVGDVDALPYANEL